MITLSSYPTSTSLLNTAISRLELCRSDWLTHGLQEEFMQPYMTELDCFLSSLYLQGKEILPMPFDWFSPLYWTSLSKTKVVLMGESPYPNKLHTDGLAFSASGCDVSYRVQNASDLQSRPAPYRNILREMERDLDYRKELGESYKPMYNPSLASWASQGVLLLNQIVTRNVGGLPHENRGWERFTSRVVEIAANDPFKKVFILLGKKIQDQVLPILNSSMYKQHKILIGEYPDAARAAGGFFFNNYFTLANEQLEDWGYLPVDWETVDLNYTPMNPIRNK